MPFKQKTYAITSTHSPFGKLDEKYDFVQLFFAIGIPSILFIATTILSDYKNTSTSDVTITPMFNTNAPDSTPLAIDSNFAKDFLLYTETAASIAKLMLALRVAVTSLPKEAWELNEAGRYTPLNPLKGPFLKLSIGMLAATVILSAMLFGEDSKKITLFMSNFMPLMGYIVAYNAFHSDAFRDAAVPEQDRHDLDLLKAFQDKIEKRYELIAQEASSAEKEFISENFLKKDSLSSELIRTLLETSQPPTSELKSAIQSMAALLNVGTRTNQETQIEDFIQSTNNPYHISLDLMQDYMAKTILTQLKKATLEREEEQDQSFIAQEKNKLEEIKSINESKLIKNFLKARTLLNQNNKVDEEKYHTLRESLISLPPEKNLDTTATREEAKPGDFESDVEDPSIPAEGDVILADTTSASGKEEKPGDPESDAEDPSIPAESDVILADTTSASGKKEKPGDPESDVEDPKTSSSASSASSASASASSASASGIFSTPQSRLKTLEPGSKETMSGTDKSNEAQNTSSYEPF